MFAIGSIFLLLSAILDLVDGSVARRTEKETRFGAVFDWIVDKYVDAIVILAIGLSGIAILSRFNGIPASADCAIVAIAIIGSLMNTFIKPVVYAETGYQERVDGKIEDPLEGVGLFGRPETILVLVVCGIAGFIWIAVVLIAMGTNFSAIQRIIYLYKRLA
jgi:archaetidylinositol phosphate synthase